MGSKKESRLGASATHGDLNNKGNGSIVGMITILALLILLAVSAGRAGVIVVLSLVAMLFLHELVFHLYE